MKTAVLCYTLPMHGNQKETPSHEQRQWRDLTLAEYVYQRNGIPLGAPGSLQEMLYRSVGASSFAQFWQQWNPIWGYGLGKYIYSPLTRLLPRVIALILTFIISGGIHDLATMAIRRSGAFLFTPWFFFLGVGVALGHAFGMDLSSRSWLTRATVNLTYLTVCLMITLAIKQIF